VQAYGKACGDIVWIALLIRGFGVRVPGGAQLRTASAVVRLASTAERVVGNSHKRSIGRTL